MPSGTMRITYLTSGLLAGAWAPKRAGVPTRTMTTVPMDAGSRDIVHSPCLARTASTRTIGTRAADECRLEPGVWIRGPTRPIPIHLLQSRRVGHRGRLTLRYVMRFPRANRLPVSNAASEIWGPKQVRSIRVERETKDEPAVVNRRSHGQLCPKRSAQPCVSAASRSVMLC